MLRILIIGMNRCGTKNLSNLLAAQPTIAAVQSEHHAGIIETNAFAALATKFPHIDIQEEYIGLVELWMKTDFLKCANVNKEFLYALSPRPINAGSMFRMIMDDYAMRCGCNAWLQKVSPQASESALNVMPDAIPIVIERHFWDALKSMHYLETKGQRPISLHLIASVVWQQRILQQLKRKKAIAVRFETVLESPEETVQILCEELGLQYNPQPVPKWKQNSSYKDAASSVFRFSLFEKCKIYLARILLAFTPTALLRMMASVFGERVEPVVVESFSILSNREFEKA
jgi:hypothetical protein